MSTVVFPQARKSSAQLLPSQKVEPKNVFPMPEHQNNNSLFLGPAALRKLHILGFCIAIVTIIVTIISLI